MADGGIAPFEWSELVPGGVVVYYADGDEEILHVNHYVLDLFECESLEEFMTLTGGTFRGFVYGSDVEATEDSIWGQVSTQNGFDHIYYQIQTKTGRVLSVDDYGRLVRHEGSRPLFYIFVVEMDRDNVIDWLTGLPGMERFQYVATMEAHAMLARACRPALLVLDLMGMRTYNAIHGRSAGDRLLCTLASILRNNFGSELCCRYSGDSFCTLVAAEGLENRVRAVFREFSSSGYGNNPPVMAGACELSEDDELPLVLDCAKIACDSDRATWESHLSWYTEDMRRESLLRTHVLEHVDQAVAEGWIRPHYQGIVRSSTGRPCCAEALARWVDPVYGPLSPAQFIPALEQSGLLRKLDLCIVQCVIDDLASRIQKGLPVIPVSVNLSLRDLVNPNIASMLIKMTDAAGVPYELLRVEFTESAVSNDPELLKSQMRALHAAGFEVWMDDFGSGFSSLNALKEFDFDLIKLDMGFVSEGNESKRAIIIDGVLRSAKHLGVRTLTEGVETAELAEELVAMGCDLLQGFHFFRPIPLDELTAAVFDAEDSRPEPVTERAYWDGIGTVSLPDLATGLGSERVGGQPVNLLPAGVLERRHGEWHLLRSTETLRAIMASRGVIPSDERPMTLAAERIELDEVMNAAAIRSDGSGDWELVGGSLEYGSGFQFSIMPLCECADAHAYVLSSTPTSLGSALGTYGDVPVAYCVLRMIYGADGEVVDAEYVYANQLFCAWGNFPSATIVGMRIRDLAADEGSYWLSLCARAAMRGEQVHDVVYGAHAGHWLSYSVTPSLNEGHCIFAFTIADAEYKERQDIILAGTHDSLTGLLNRRGIDEEISRQMHERPEEPLVLVLIRVDDFKAVNDLYGRDVGDEALRVLAQKLVSTFPKTAVIGRNGADEALVALFGHDAFEIETLMHGLMSPKFLCVLNGRRYTLSISAGYAWCLKEDDLKTTYSRAAEALYTVKLAARTGYQEWVPGLQEARQSSLLGFTTRELARGMPLAMLAHRLDGEILFANDGLARLLGYDALADTLKGVRQSMQGIIHPDDWEGFHHAMVTEFLGKPLTNEFELRLHVVTKTGFTRAAAYRARHIATQEKGEVVYAYIVGEGEAADR